MVETLTTPYLLLAAPAMTDPNFAKSVVLMGHHTNDGALGWIVNRVLDTNARSLLVAPFDEKVHPETPLRLGGPVQTSGLVVVFRGASPVAVETVEMAPGLSVCASPEILGPIFGDAPSGAGPAGLLVWGYAGWGPGQLEREMEEGAWLVLPYDAAFAFPTETDRLWDRALARLGVSPETVATPPGGVN